MLFFICFLFMFFWFLFCLSDDLAGWLVDWLTAACVVCIQVINWQSKKQANHGFRKNDKQTKQKKTQFEIREISDRHTQKLMGPNKKKVKKQKNFKFCCQTLLRL